jgi:hypothetical protein
MLFENELLSRIELNYKLKKNCYFPTQTVTKKELLPNDVSSLSFNYETKVYYENENKNCTTSI